MTVCARVDAINERATKGYYQFLADKTVRKHFFELKGDICEYCGRKILDSFNKIIEHKKSYYERGGNNLYDNLALACRRCNSIKKSLTEEELYSNRRFQEWVLEVVEVY